MEFLKKLMTRACVAGVVVLALSGCGSTLQNDASGADSAVRNVPVTSAPLNRSEVPSPDQALIYQAIARKILDSMSVQERIGQTMMAPLNVVTSSPDSVRSFISDGKVGSVLYLGNWKGGTTQLAQVSATLQSYASASNKLLIAADQEGGQVQHLQGTGFTRMPSAVWQGSQSAETLRQLAAGWGSELKSAGVNVNLSPVVGTVQTQTRAQNAPIGALNRDFGKDAVGNAESAAAFIQGMQQAGMLTSIKHYPGLGAVTGNTDFTANGIVDTSTTLGGAEEGAFAQALSANPSMVMMSLATYSAIDPDHPAAFSSKLITDRLRGQLGFEGVVTSDSMSAAAVHSIPADQLGVQFLEAGGDLVCVGDPGTAHEILEGMQQKAQESEDFRALVDDAALRVLTLKVSAGLAHAV